MTAAETGSSQRSDGIADTRDVSRPDIRFRQSTAVILYPTDVIL